MFPRLAFPPQLDPINLSNIYPPPCLQALLASVALLSDLKNRIWAIFLFILFYETLFRDFSASFAAVTWSYLEMGNSQIRAFTFQYASEVPKNHKILTDGPDNGPQRLPEATDT